LCCKGSSGNSYSQLLRALNYPETVKEVTISNELRSINDKLKALNPVKIKVANGIFSLDPLSDDIRAKVSSLFVSISFEKRLAAINVRNCRS
jgi:hypothetical protein